MRGLLLVGLCLMALSPDAFAQVGFEIEIDRRPPKPPNDCASLMDEAETKAQPGNVPALRDAIDADERAAAAEPKSRCAKHARARVATWKARLHDDASVHVSLGRQFLAGGEYQMARAELRKALEIDPYDKSVESDLATAETKLRERHIDQLDLPTQDDAPTPAATSP